MSFCPSCGKELSPEESNSKFCAYCGKPLEVAEETTKEEATTADEAVTVEEPVTPEAAPATEQPAQEKIKDKLVELKDKIIPVINQIVEKAKTVPFINKLLEKVDKKFYPAIVAAPVALVVLLLVIIIAVASSGSYMTPVNEFIKLANKQTADSQKLTYALSPDFRVNLLKKIVSASSKSDLYQDSIENVNDLLEDNFDELNDEFDKWTIKFEVKSKEKMDKDDVEELAEEYEDYYDDYLESSVDNYEDILDDDDELESYADMMDLSEKEAKAVLKAYINYYKSFEDVKITEAYKVKGKFIVETDDDDYKTDTVKIYLVKINGDWAYAGCDDSLSLEDSDGYFDFIFNYLETSYLNQ